MVSRQVTRSGALALLAVLAVACNKGNDPPKLSAIAVFDADGTPLEGADIVVHDATGAVVRTLLTDVDGRAQTAVPDNGAVTVPIAGTQAGLDTFSGLTPGTNLRFGGYNGTLGVVDVTLVAFPGAAAYYLDNGCSFVFVLDTGSPISIQYTSPCGASMDVIATALDASSQPIAYITALGQDPDVAFGMSNWQTDFVTLSLEGTNAPAGSETFTGVPRVRRNGLFYTISGKARAPVTEGNTATVDLLIPPGFGDVEYTAEIVYDTDGSTSEIRILDGATVGTVVLDLDALMLEPAFGLDHAVTQAGRPDVTWIGGDPTADLVLFTSEWIDSPSEGTWLVHAPPEVTSALRFPAVPAEMLTSTPRTATSTFSGSSLRFIDVDYANGYDAYLGFIATNVNPPSSYAIRTATAIQ